MAVRDDDPQSVPRLSRAGVADARQAGRILSAYRVDEVYHSSAARARETWSNAALGGASSARPAQVDEVLSHAARGDIVALVESLDDSVATALIIAHNPGLGDAVPLLCAPGQPVRYLASGLANAQIVVLSFDGPWEDAAGHMLLACPPILARAH